VPPIDVDEHSPETELLMCCARTQVDDKTAAQVQDLVDASIDWNYVLKYADEHMVLPLVHHTLSKAAPNSVPTPVQNRLRARFRNHVRNNLLLTHELLNLLGLFDEHGIPVLPLKGPVAAASVYGDLNLRPFVDLDLLVHLQDVPRAQELLLSQQYEKTKSLPTHFDQPTSWRLILTEPASKELPFVRDSGKEVPMRVELHWDLAPRNFQYPLDPDSLWERLRTVTLLDKRVRTFSPEDTLLYFCLHGTLHRWKPLRLVCDVAELLQRHPELNWEWLLNEAERLHSKRLLLLGLRLSHELLEAPLPSSIRKRVYSHDAVASLTELVLPRLLRRSRDVTAHPLPWEWEPIAFYLQVRDRLRDGIGSCIQHTRRGLGWYIYHSDSTLPASLRKWWKRLSK
jgi:hypothetical protein